MSDILPNKSLGQHWLHDGASLKAMADTAEVAKGDTILEIGPGLGTLTEVLLGRGANVTAIEFDETLFKNLKNTNWPNFTLINEDILKFDLNKLPKRYKVVANIPYYLTSKLIRNLLESKNPPNAMALLIQKEVAERIVAQPGQMSILAISVQFYCEVELGQQVPAELFTPPPKVDSQIIQIKQRLEPLFSEVNISEYFKIVKAGFSEKRKKLRSSLSGGLHIDKTEVDRLLKTAGIPAGARAQELSLDQWHELTKLFFK